MVAYSLVFLDFPKEVRLMIYELLPITTRHHTLADPSFESTTPEVTTPSVIVLVTKSAVVSMLSTCHTIYQEYRPILDKNLQILRTEPLRFIVDSASLDTFMQMENSIASLIRSHRDHIRAGEELFFQPPMSLPVLDSTETSELAAIVHFVNKCAVHAEARSPTFTVLAIRRYPTDNMTDYISVVAHTHRAISASPCGLEPLGWLLHEVALDAGFTLPGHRQYTVQHFKDEVSSSTQLAQYWVDDMVGDDWSRIWEEGEILA
jgi:hypothetical protein